jgi:hypothetical protein
MYQPFFEATRDFFARAKHGGEVVPTIFARADRAHMELARIMKRRLQGKKTIKGETAQEPPTDTKQALEDRPAPVPFMSVWLTPPQYDPARANTAHRFKVAENRDAGTALVMRFPRPITSEVQVDLWCGSKGGERIANDIQAQIDLQFLAESVYLPVDWTLEKWYKPPFNVLEHARFLGKTRVRLITEGWTDNSDAEWERGPKETRRTWTGRLEGYIAYRPNEARLVRSVVLDVEDATVNPSYHLDDLTIGGDD